ncbi:MAG: hypothetical protein JWP52_2769, partial [Rhizobacter sp.]|nr:hypothetical protein [Rhizobacter sp.]
GLICVKPWSAGLPTAGLTTKLKTRTTALYAPLFVSKAVHYFTVVSRIAHGLTQIDAEVLEVPERVMTASWALQKIVGVRWQVVASR